MAFNWVAVGSLAGFLSLAIQLIRIFITGPNLSFHIEKPQHHYHKEDRTFSVWVTINIDNTGERGTTINRIELIDISDKKLLDRFNPESRYGTHILPHSSSHIRWDRTIFDTDELTYDELKIQLKLYWTHYSKKLPSFITKPHE